jgi:hypothetical protein
MECHLPVVQLLLDHVKARHNQHHLHQQQQPPSLHSVHQSSFDDDSGGGRSDGPLAAFVNAQNANGETAAHFAAEVSKFKVHSPLEDQIIIRKLIDAGANVAQLATRPVSRAERELGTENVGRSNMLQLRRTQ